MTADIKVSVIIPIYNTEKYLRQCLDSIVGQTLRDIEIICVDDGSKDKSLEILKEYARKDERFRIIEQVNSGAGAARNAGMAVAQGRYLAFMDADDLYYPAALEQTYVKAVNENADMLAFDAKYFAAGLEWENSQINSLLLAGRQMVSAENDPQLLFQLFSCNTWCKLYKRELVQGTGLRYQEIKTANDLCFVCSAMACAGKITVLDKPFVKHRVLYSGNLQSVKVKTPLDFMAALGQLKQNLQQFGLWENLKQSYLNCALSHFVYNWQTLDKKGQKQIAAKAQEITALLELEKHPADYYYSQNDYVLMGKVVNFNREGDLTMKGRFKNLLKHILPPPVNAFNREVNGLKQYMLELSAGLKAQQKLQQEQYTEELAMLAAWQKEQFAVLSEQQNLFVQNIQRNEELFKQLSQQNAEIQVRLEEMAAILSDNSKTDDNERKALGSAIERARRQAADSSRYASEAVWAWVFNNTITNSAWLHDKTFSPGRWALGYSGLYVLYRILNEVRPKRILELGLGQSTRMIGQYASAYKDVDHIAVEHDFEWIDIFKSSFTLSAQSKIIQMDRKMVPYKDGENVRIFDNFQETFQHQKFDFIFIDAPYGADMKQYARIDILEILPDCLSDNFIILMDDYERSGEAHTVTEIEQALKATGICYSLGRYRGKKDIALFTAEHLKFLTTM